MRLFIIVLTSLALHAQSVRPWQVGAQLGLNIPAYRTNKPVQEATIMPGFTGGLVLRYELGPRWALQSGLYFSQRNSTYRTTESTQADTTVGGSRDRYTVHITNRGRLELGHLEVPLLVELDFLKSSPMRSYFLVGVHAGYRLFAHNYGTTQVALEGLDFLPLFGFSPQTRLIVAEGPIEPNRVTFRQGDMGLWLGGGNAYTLKRGQMIFEIRAFAGVVNLFKEPADTRFYNGSVLFLTGWCY